MPRKRQDGQQEETQGYSGSGSVVTGDGWGESRPEEYISMRSGTEESPLLPVVRSMPWSPDGSRRKQKVVGRPLNDNELELLNAELSEGEEPFTLELLDQWNEEQQNATIQEVYKACRQATPKLSPRVRKATLTNGQRLVQFWIVGKYQKRQQQEEETPEREQEYADAE